ncbi:hypothetical protein JB92DRAFT_2832894 [Gautieria morchelliformis]|nr:hypothetical protein JB92DRAFT_2832894 [Gautieria morchelliformis]
MIPYPATHKIVAFLTRSPQRMPAHEEHRLKGPPLNAVRLQGEADSTQGINKQLKALPSLSFGESRGQTRERMALPSECHSRGMSMMLDRGVGCDECERSPGADEDGHRSVEGRRPRGAVCRIAHGVNSLALKMMGMAAFQAYAKDVCICNASVDAAIMNYSPICKIIIPMSTIQINLKLLMQSKHSRNYNYQAEVSSISAHVRGGGGRGQRIEGMWVWLNCIAELTDNHWTRAWRKAIG